VVSCDILGKNAVVFDLVFVCM
jgi:hypothetical protein